MQSMTKHLRASSILSATCIGLAATVGAGVAHATVDQPKVKYDISGSSPVASYLSFQTDHGQQQQTNVKLPWSAQFIGYGGGVYVISAEGQGTITCRITVDGNVVKEATATGAPGRTVCTN
jgi:Mycobacterium membrane protein